MQNQDAISPEFLTDLAKRIVGGESLPAFSEWFVTTFYGLQRDPQDVTPIDAQSRRMLLALARQFWSRVPRPASHWRAQSLPKIERNDACYCGSLKKYKQCCAEFATLPIPLDDDVLFALALDCIEPDQMSASDWAHLPPLALAQAATFWSDRGEPKRVVQVLGPYFRDHPKLDERSEPALDALFGALQDLGLEADRVAWAVLMSEHKNKAIATTARCRHVVMLADRGDFANAWKIFEQAQRGNPSDPQLTHLEMMVLLTEGREDEAALRGQTLATQLRRRGPDFYDLAEVVERMGRDGFAGMSRAMADREDVSELDEDVPDWLVLFGAMPEAPTEWSAHYTLERSSNAPSEATPDARLSASNTMAALEAKWARRFPTTAPSLIALEGDAESLLEDVVGVGHFLYTHPDAWHSFVILDDLLAAGYTLADENESVKLDHACLKLAQRGVENLRGIIGKQPAHLPWAVAEHRPALRSAARAIELSQRVANQPQAIALAEWMLAVNPNDNHGNRDFLVGAYLVAHRAADALTILDRYPEDNPITLFNRTLCLFKLRRKDEAAACWAHAAVSSPHVPGLLLAAAPPAALDNNEDDDYITLGSYEEAHRYASECHAIWARDGALDWARALPQLKAPDKRAAKPARSTAPSRAPAASMFDTLPALTQALWSELDALFDDTVMLHGFVVGIAMSPGRGNGSVWTGTVISMTNIDLGAGASKKNFARVNAALPIVLNLHNSIRADLFEPQRSTRTPADWLKPIDMNVPNHPARWAKGFIRAAESLAAEWQRVKLPVNSASGPLAPLYAMAARAPLSKGSDAWRVQNEAQRPLFAEVSQDTRADGEQLTAFITQLQTQLKPFNGAQAG